MRCNGAPRREPVRDANLDVRLHFYPGFSSADLLKAFKGDDGAPLDDNSRLAIAKLLFGIEKTVEDAWREIRRRGL